MIKNMGLFFGIMLILSLLALGETAAGSPKIEFWRHQRKGANFFNQVPTRQWLEAASKLGIQFIRLAPDKWKSTQRDFLIGNADHYESINEHDLAKLLGVLNDAHALNLKVVITMLSLPGARWTQNNNDKSDWRLWQDDHYQEQAFRFWQALVQRLKDHPALIGYDPLNEPHPGRDIGHIDDGESSAYETWVTGAKDTPADLNRFNRRMVAAIREVDPQTPIWLESDAFDSPVGYRFMEPVDDPNVIYSFHFYEPWNYTSKRANQGRFAYPHRMPAPNGVHTETWRIENLKRLLQPVIDWSLRYRIASNRIIVGEFGCNREIEGAANYLRDLIEIFNNAEWHWAFYAFREDTWDGMDYEIGTDKLPWKYWQDVEAGKQPEPPRRGNPLFEVFKREFQKKLPYP